MKILSNKTGILALSDQELFNFVTQDVLGNTIYEDVKGIERAALKVLSKLKKEVRHV